MAEAESDCKSCTYLMWEFMSLRLELAESMGITSIDIAVKTRGLLLFVTHCENIGTSLTRTLTRLRNGENPGQPDSVQ